MKPLNAAAVENALRKKLDADTGYSGLPARIRTTVTGKLPFGSQNSTRWTGLLIFDLNAANNKEIVADYGLGRNCTCSIKHGSGHIALSVRAGLNMTSGCKLAMNVPVLTTCNFHRLWMIMR
jgi:hypothetical protein